MCDTLLLSHADDDHLGISKGYTPKQNGVFSVGLYYADSTASNDAYVLGSPSVKSSPTPTSWRQPNSIIGIDYAQIVLGIDLALCPEVTDDFVYALPPDDPSPYEFRVRDERFREVTISGLVMYEDHENVLPGSPSCFYDIPPMRTLVSTAVPPLYRCIGHRYIAKHFKIFTPKDTKDAFWIRRG